MIAINHSFVADLKRTPEAALAAFALIEHLRRRTGNSPGVHPSLANFEIEGEKFVQWANRVRSDPSLRALAELLLRTLSGPFVYGDVESGAIAPPISGLAEWLQETIRILLGLKRRAAGAPDAMIGLLSPVPSGGASSGSYTSGATVVVNWQDAPTFDRDLSAASQSRSTRAVLDEAVEKMGGRLIALSSAVRSADDWVLDCNPSVLLAPLLGLEEYVAALQDGLPREKCAERYQNHCGIPMSRESSDVERRPERKQQRTFIAGPNGKQFFDMHAKPGLATRVHIWIAPSAGNTPRTIYVGHCGKHLS